MKTLAVQLLPHRQSLLRDIVIASLALLSAGLLVFELSADLLAEQVRLIYTVDVVIAFLFLADFAYEFVTSKQKMKYFKANWYLLLASIPITGGMFQALRSVQLIRLVRIVRLYARIKAISEQTELYARNSSRYIFVSLFAVVVIFCGGAAFYLAESAANDRVNTFFDGIWWAVVSATSVGYGDIYPETFEGRIVAMILMFFGLAMLGTIVGIVSNYFLATEEIRQVDTTNTKD